MMSAPKLPAAAQTRTAPGAAVPGGFKGRNASFKTAAASYLVYPTDERTGTPARKAEQACGPSQGSPYSPMADGTQNIGRLQSRRPRPNERRWDRIFALRKMTLGCFVTVFLCADGIGKNPETNTDIRHKKAYETA